MPLPQDIDARRYYRVAYQRLGDAVALTAPAVRRPSASVYLAGYAVECMTKAWLIELTPRSQRATLLRSLRGGYGHDLRRLWQDVHARGVSLPDDVRQRLAHLSTWTVTMRYDPRPVAGVDAENFVAETRRLLAWIEIQL